MGKNIHIKLETMLGSEIFIESFLEQLNHLLEIRILIKSLMLSHVERNMVFTQGNVNKSAGK